MLCQILLATGGTQLDSTGGVESVVDLISGMPVCSKFSDFRNFDILGKK